MIADERWTDTRRAAVWFNVTFDDGRVRVDIISDRKWVAALELNPALAIELSDKLRSAAIPEIPADQSRP